MSGTAPGSVLGVRGLVLRLSLPSARLGERLALPDGALLEVVGFDGVEANALPLTRLEQVVSGAPVRRVAEAPRIYAGPALRGRVVDGLGRPLEGTLPAPNWAVQRAAPPPLERRPVEAPLPVGVRAVDGLFTLGRGQRVGLVSGPGLGKSTLLARIAARAAVDTVVVALVGERGREAGAFLDRLGAARERAVVVLARADDPPLAWLRAAETATAIAEQARAEGEDVLLVLDSLTRVARAARTVGVAAGEPVTRRGFPPSMATTIQRLLERAGNDAHGTLSAVYAVLVEGYLHDDPVAEEAQGLLDGHLVLDEERAAAGWYPAIDFERSVSRCMEAVVDPAHREAARALRGWVAASERHRDLRAVGAYHPGADLEADAYEARRAEIEWFLKQDDVVSPFEETVERLVGLVRGR